MHMLKRFPSPRKSIQNKIFWPVMALIILPSFFIGFSAYFISIDTVKKEVSVSFAESVDYTRKSVETELYQIKQIADYIFMDTDLKDAIIQKDQDLKTSIAAEDRLLKKLEQYVITNTFRNIESLKVYGNSGYELSFGDSSVLTNINDERIKTTLNYYLAVHSTGKIIWYGIHDEYLKVRTDGKHEVVSFVRAVRDKYYNENIGAIYMSFSAEPFSALTSNLNRNTKSKIFIFDNDNEIVNTGNAGIDRMLMARAQAVLEYEGALQNNSLNQFEFDDHMYFTSLIDEFGWKVVGIIPTSEIAKNNRNILRAAALAFGLSFIATGFIWWAISVGIVRPVKQLTRAARSIRKGEFGVRVDYRSEDEIGILTNNFNFMSEKIEDLLQQMIEENSHKKDAEYRALQAQINPHFLYNTLNTIRWMAIIQNADNIKKMVEALSRLLANTTSKVGQFITIGDEINNLKDYIYIQKIAYKNKFKVFWDVDEETLSCRCIKFFLQPVVENAIFHGIDPKDGVGTISISVRRKEQSIVIEVVDDGIGMSSKKANDLLHGKQEEGRKFSGIGISNVYERIKMTYEEKSNMTIESKPGEGTSVVIVIPMEEGESSV